MLVFGAVFGLYALNMDTTVDSGAFGRVNNIGLLSDQQNYVIVSGLAFLAGVIMLIAAPRLGAPKSGPTQGSQIDPFDALDAEKSNLRKQYAISLGVTRRDGKFQFNNVSYNDVEEAIVAAEGRLNLPR